MSSYVFRTNVFIRTFELDFSCSRSISMKSGEMSSSRPIILFSLSNTIV